MSEFWDVFEKFVDNLKTHGLEFYGRFYGVYDGICVSNADPAAMGRILVKVPAISGSTVLGTPAMPTAVYAGNNHGFYFVPEKDEGINVWFENGDPRYPRYCGQWFGTQDTDAKDFSKTELPEEFRPAAQPSEKWDGDPVRKNGIKILTEDGAKFFLLLFDKTPEEESLQIAHPMLSNMEFDKEGSIRVKDTNENEIFLDTPNKQIVITNKGEGNENVITCKGESITIDHGGKSTITMTEGNLTIETNDKVDVKTSVTEITADKIMLGASASEPGILGGVFKQWIDQFVQTTFNSHIHPASTGPTGIPAVPGQIPTPATYSDRVFLKK